MFYCIKKREQLKGKNYFVFNHASSFTGLEQQDTYEVFYYLIMARVILPRYNTTFTSITNTVFNKEHFAAQYSISL